jgi:hypothetical protein
MGEGAVPAPSLKDGRSWVRGVIVDAIGPGKLGPVGQLY